MKKCCQHWAEKYREMSELNEKMKNKINEISNKDIENSTLEELEILQIEIEELLGKSKNLKEKELSMHR